MADAQQAGRKSLAERFPSFGRVCLMAAVAGAPAVLLPASIDVFQLTKLSLIWLSTVAAAWFWFASSSGAQKRIPRFGLGYAAGAFVAAFGIATLLSQNRQVSMLGLYRRYGGFLPVLIYAVVMVLIVAFFWERPGELKAIPVAAAAGCVPVAGYALVQAAGYDWVTWLAGGVAPARLPGSTMGNSNFLGGYLGIAIPFLVFLAVSLERKVVRAGAGVLLAAAALALWASGSRGGLIAAAGGLFCMAFVQRERLARSVRRALAVLAAVGIVVTVLVVWHPGMQAPPGPLAKMDVLRTDTFKLRGYYWSAALNMFFDNPLFGTGPDTYSENYSGYRPAGDADRPGRGHPDKPHNIYLEYAAGSGVLGGGTFLLMTGLALRYGFRRAKDSPAGEKLLLGTFLAAYVAYLIQGFFSMDLPPLALMGWVAIGAIAVLADPRILQEREAAGARVSRETRSRKEEKAAGRGAGKGAEAEGRADSPSRRLRPAGALVLSGLAAIALLAAGMTPLWGDVEAKTAMSPNTELEEGLAGLRHADRIQIWASPYRTMASWRVVRAASRAPENEKEDVFRRAHSWLLEAAQEEPESLFAALNLASVNAAWAGENSARYPVADKWWKKVVELQPSDWRFRLNYGSFLGNWALELDDPAPVGRRARRTLERAAAMRPDNPDIWVALGKSYILTREMGRARSAFETALRINPHFSPAKVWLGRLGVPASRPRDARLTKDPN